MNYILGYQYKMQWLCDANQAIDLIRVIGARSLTVINTRDRKNGLKIIDRYSDMVSYEGKEATRKAIKWIRLKNQINRELDYELLRK